MDSALFGLWILALGLFLGLKSKNSQEQNVKEFQFYIGLPNFRLRGSIIKKVGKSVGLLNISPRVVFATSIASFSRVLQNNKL